MRLVPSASLGLILVAIGLAAASPSETVTRKGWFADEKCSTERVRNGRKGPPGQACTRDCIARGVKVVFIDERTGALYRVDNPKPTKGIESDYVEVHGTRNEAAKTVHVDTVRVIETYVARCSVP